MNTMSQTNNQNLTQLLVDWTNGNELARDQLISLVYNELREIASRHLCREHSNHLLQTTALVHEAYIKLIDVKSVQWQNRAHFFAIAAKLMRQILVNNAYNIQTQKRGGDAILLTINEGTEIANTKNWEITALNDALLELETRSPRQCMVVELRFFGGLTNEEVGEVLKVDPRTVKRDWSIARAWLISQLHR
jgi:RNA polymerase sigma factor (TIGR02999 family)